MAEFTHDEFLAHKDDLIKAFQDALEEAEVRLESLGYNVADIDWHVSRKPNQNQ